MRRPVIVVVLTLGTLCVASRSFAQTGFDSACFFPAFGDKNGWDTICGPNANQHLGDYLCTLPPLKGQKYGRLLFKNVPGHGDYLSAFETGPGFDLRHLKFIKDYPSRFTNITNARFGHFRNREQLDMFIPDGGRYYHGAVYWADEQGDFDTGRYTEMLPQRFGKYGVDPRIIPAYTAKLTSDSVEDIVFAFQLNDTTTSLNEVPVVLCLIKGGESLYAQMPTAMWDDTVNYATFYSDADSVTRYNNSADWRGVGRKDLITIDARGNFFHYRNDPPFDLHRFAHSLKNDTLLRIADWSGVPKLLRDPPFPSDILSMQAFPKKAGDSSSDLVVALPLEPSIDYNDQNGICIFRGGPDFGSKRIGYDSADYFMHCPGYYDVQLSQADWPTLRNAGDLTGTGNNVLVTSGGYVLGAGFWAMYVTGKALDDQIDMFTSVVHSAGFTDTIVTDASGKPTLIHGAAYLESENYTDAGSIQLFRGAVNMPVHLNPTFRVPRRSASGETVRLGAYPNPCESSTSLTYEALGGQPLTIEVINTLGTVCKRLSVSAQDGVSQYSIPLGGLPAGAYSIRLFDPTSSTSRFARVVKLSDAQ